MKNKITCLLLLLQTLLVAQTSTFSININGTVPAGFEDGLKTAAKNWSKYLQIYVPIKVNVFTINTSLAPFSGLTLANGRKNFTNAPYSNYLYPNSLANQLAGTVTNPGQYDMDIYFNLASNFYFGNGAPPSNALDFISTAMHEIGHGLGFYSDGYVDANGKGSFGNIPPSVLFFITTSFPWRGQDSVPTIYDKYLLKASGNPLATCAPFNSTALGDSIKNGMLYFDGPLFANISPGGKARVAGGTGTYFFGEDLLHLHDTYPNTIMSYYWGPGDTVRMPAPRELGVLKQIGWNLSSEGVGLIEKFAQKAQVYPNPSNDIVNVYADQLSGVQLYGLDGRLLLSEQKTGMVNNVILNTAQLEDGIYLLVTQYSGGKNSETIKLQVSHSR